jgi:tRNA uridine 5-carbamoylmethylation protein Kti12
MLTGSPIAVLLRGLPGSGKSWQARTICDQYLGSWSEKQRYQGICSTDDYFYHEGEYRFDASKLGENHQFNQNRFKQLLRRRWPVVVCDNTNMQLWEMLPYLSAAKKQGYRVWVIEVALPAQDDDVARFAARNRHGVALPILLQMASRFEPFVPCAGVELSAVAAN